MDGDIAAALTGGNPRKLENERVIELVLRDTDRIGELVACVLHPDEIVRLRASDALEKVCSERPDLLQPHVEVLLTDMAAVDQASVQWHLAQIYAQIELTGDQRRRAIEIMFRNLDRFDDWIVTNLTLQSIAAFARSDATIVPRLVGELLEREHSAHASVRKRVGRLLAEFAPRREVRRASV